ncbi:MAG: translation initiation factor [Chitinophagales bacterium]|nr:translation initiation factor [Chitinophagales bacterium]
MTDDWKKKLGNIGVYSTNPDYKFDTDDEEETTLSNQEQTLIVSLDKKHRKGKVVTLVEGFVGKEDDLKQLAKMLKTKCGVGGSAKDNVIVIQGDFKQKIKDLLTSDNFKVKLK